ncbi:MAG TPA: flagellar hook-length control protein FliK [Stellaceae bacterium]|nr:flagellar hook-length control protein FliK [Stellaceae bacterium]
MLTTRAIVATRSVGEAARRGTAGNGEASGSGFGAVLDAASDASKQPGDAAAAPAPDRARDPHPHLLAATTAANGRRFPLLDDGDAATAGPPVAGGKGMPDAAPASHRRANDSGSGDPQHRPPPTPSAAAAMSLVVPLVLIPAASGQPAGETPEATLPLADQVAPATDRGSFSGWGAGISDAAGGASPVGGDGAAGTPGAVDGAAASAPGTPSDTDAAFTANGAGGATSAAPSRDSTRELSALRAPPETRSAANVVPGSAVQPVSATAAADRSTARAGDDGATGIAAMAISTSLPGAAAAAAGAATPAASAGPADAADLAAQVVSRMAGALAPGNVDIVMHLHPPELGELNVRVQVSGHEVSAWFDSPLAQVQLALSQGMGQLRAGLADVGYSLNNAWIGGDAWTPRGGTASPTRRALVAAGSPAVTTEPAALSPAAGAGVSLYV